MSSHSFTWVSEPRGAGVSVYTPAGTLYGSHQSYAFQDELRARCAQGETVVVDLARVDRIDSCGVGILVAIYASALSGKGRLVIAGATESVERVLRHSWVLKIVPHAPTVDAALG